jgi:hypothetical protein
MVREDGGGRSIKLDEITGTWPRMGQYFRDLQGVRLKILGEMRPREARKMREDR